MKFTVEAETRNLDLHIAALVAALPINNTIILKKVAFDVLKEVIFRWPVDTGMSRAAWLASVEKLGVGGAVRMKAVKTTKHDAEAKGRRMSSIESNLHGSKQYILIKNRVRYAIYLEYGHSSQAPYGAVRLAMRKVSGQDISKAWKKKVRMVWNTWI